MLAVDRAWGGVSRHTNTATFVTSALISSGATLMWESKRARKNGKSLYEQVTGDVRKARRVGKALTQATESLVVNAAVPLRRPILPYDTSQEPSVLKPVGPLIDNVGIIQDAVSPFAVTLPDPFPPTYTIQLVSDIVPGPAQEENSNIQENINVTTVQPIDQGEIRPRRSWLAKLSSSSLQYVTSIPFRIAAWKDERRDLKLLKDAEYYYRHTPMGYNE